jgi:hypothetical protein
VFSLGQMRNLRVAAVLAVVVALAAAAGCTSVQAPTSDTTPPALTWHVENRTGSTTQDVTGSGTVTGQPGDDFRITLTATDPQGIHAIDLNGGYTEQCDGGNNVAQQENGDFAPQSQTLSKNAQNKVLTSIFLLANADHETDCNSGFTWAGTTIEFTGVGTNFFNGTTSGTLDLTESS